MKTLESTHLAQTYTTEQLNEFFALTQDLITLRAECKKPVGELMSLLDTIRAAHTVKARLLREQRSGVEFAFSIPE